MEWLDRWNEALDYLERNLSGEIDYQKAARLACCSVYHFQRMFPYITGVSLSEYIRRRRMTAAAFDLKNGGKVLDVALRYGYESPTAFNRAFQNVHGVSPSSARGEGAVLKAFPRISFKIIIKGDTEMEYRIEKKEAFRIVGVKKALSKDMEENFKEVPQFWQEAAQSGAIPRLMECMDQDMKGILGVSICTDGEEAWNYVIGVASSQPVPEGMAEATIPASTWAVFPGKGTMPHSIQETEKRAVTEWLPTSGYEYANAPDIELYLNADPANAMFEVWLPIKKKDGTAE